jgi:hypothetical protein
MTRAKLSISTAVSLCALVGFWWLVVKPRPGHESSPVVRPEAAPASSRSIQQAENPPPRSPGAPPGVGVPGKTAELPVTRRRGGSVAGRVLDETGKPVAGAVVQAGVSADTIDESDKTLASVLGSSATVDLEGRYTLGGLPPRKDYVLRASHPEFAPTSLEDIGVGENEAMEGMDLILLRGGMIVGRVIDEAGNAIAGARI